MVYGGGTIDDVCNGGVGEGGVGEGRGGGCLEDDGRRIKIESVDRVFSTISGNIFGGFNIFYVLDHFLSWC